MKVMLWDLLLLLLRKKDFFFIVKHKIEVIPFIFYNGNDGKSILFFSYDKKENLIILLVKHSFQTERKKTAEREI